MTILYNTLPNSHLFVAQRLPLTQNTQFFQISDLFLEICACSYRLFFRAQAAQLHRTLLALSKPPHTGTEKPGLLPWAQRRAQNKRLGNKCCLNCHMHLLCPVQHRRGSAAATASHYREILLWWWKLASPALGVMLLSGTYTNKAINTGLPWLWS